MFWVVSSALFNLSAQFVPLGLAFIRLSLLSKSSLVKRIFTQANFSLETIGTWDPSTTGSMVRYNSQIVSRCAMFRGSLFEKEPLEVGFGCRWISLAQWDMRSFFRYICGHVSRRQRSCCLLGKLLATSPKLS